LLCEDQKSLEEVSKIVDQNDLAVPFASLFKMAPVRKLISDYAQKQQ